MATTLAPETRAQLHAASGDQPRLRALLVGLLLAAFLGVATPYSDMFLQDSRLGYSALPLGPLALLFLMLTCWNLLARRLSPALAWRRTELLLIYCMSLATIGLVASGVGDWLLQVTAAPFYYATTGNKWQQLFIKYIPPWLHPPNQGYVITGLFEGLSRGRQMPWRAWLVPLSAWALFTFFFFGAHACWGLILRRRWIESERLTFPLTQVPLSLVGAERLPPGKSTILRNRLFWLGFLIPAAFHTFSSLGVYFQGLPQLKVTALNVGAGLVNRPWNSLKDLRIDIIFSLIGISYLLTSEISLSMWLFYWFHETQMLILTALGFGEVETWWTSAKIERNQEEGAFFVLVLFLLWTARKELIATWKAALKRGWWRRADQGEPVPFVIAVAGFLACFLGMIAWLTLAGGRPHIVALFLITQLVAATTLARLVNAGGAIFVECSFPPQDVTHNFLGTKAIGASTFSAWAPVSRVYTFDAETLVVPAVMDSLKIAHSSRINGAHLLVGVLGALFVTLVCAHYTMLRLAYGRGGLSLLEGAFSDDSHWAYRRLVDHINNPSRPKWPDVFFTSVGAAFMWLLIFVQTRFLWWPVHPLGFVMGSTGTARILWFSFFLGWLIRRLVQRYGGYAPYRRLVPMAIGVVVGEYITAGAFTLLDAVIGKTGHAIFPFLEG